MSTRNRIIYGITIAALLTSCGTTKKAIPLQKNKARPLADAYYTGCVGGLIAVHDNGYRNKHEKGKLGFTKHQDRCREQAFDYFWFLSGGGGDV